MEDDDDDNGDVDDVDGHSDGDGDGDGSDDSNDENTDDDGSMRLHAAGPVRAHSLTPIEGLTFAMETEVLQLPLTTAWIAFEDWLRFRAADKSSISTTTEALTYGAHKKHEETCISSSKACNIIDCHGLE